MAMFTIMLAATLAVVPQTRLDTTLAVRPGDRLAIENQSGATVVRSWDRNELRVRASRGSSERIDIERSGSTVRVETSSRRGPAGTVEFEITVPRSFGLNIETQSGAIDVAGVDGDIAVETVFGGIVLSDLAGRIHAGTVHGEVSASGISGELQVENVNGRIRVDGHDGDLTASSVNGPIVLTGIRSAAVHAETLNGGVEYSGQIRDNGRYSLATHNGDLVLTVPEGTNATVSAETFRAQIEVDFPVQLRSSAGQGHVSFTLGNGSARIELETFGGAIRLRRSAGQAARTR